MSEETLPSRALERRPSGRRLARELGSLRKRVVSRAARIDLSEFGANRESARNLLHYLALRRVDLREVQRRLTDLGLSSLGRAEGHVLHQLDAVLSHLGERVPPSGAPPARALSPGEGRRILDRRARRLLGARPAGRTTRIMVTLPTEAANDYPLVRDLVAAGTDVARINCAHDSESEWARMVDHVRRAERETGRPCRIEMDLAGPKLRTGPIPPRPPVLRVRPRRDDFGRVLAPGPLWLSGSPRALRADGPATIRVDPTWLRTLRVPGVVRVVDARGASRELRLLRRLRGSVEAETSKTVYLSEGTRLRGRTAGAGWSTARVESVPASEPSIRLRVGDRLRIGSPPRASRASSGPKTSPALREPLGTVPCTLPEALPAVRVGHRIWFDDGKIGAVVDRVDPQGVEVRVTHASRKGSRLRADRGINLPDTDLPFPSLTEEDRRHLPYVVDLTDLVGYSFVRSAADVRDLREELAKLGRPHRGIVLKIEARPAFDELPGILLEALRGLPAAIMIARGDLAVEVGYDRLAEVQEEILWLCEAAHLPVIWATEVLAGLAKVGVPTRAEVTDAAMGGRAECVMLNKGPHIVDAVRALDSILRRMQAHQEKKSARLRHLSVAERFFRSADRTSPGIPSGLPLGSRGNRE